MAKKRVYEYAKELDVPTKSVIDKAKELGIETLKPYEIRAFDL